MNLTPLFLSHVRMESMLHYSFPSLLLLLLLLLIPIVMIKYWISTLNQPNKNPPPSPSKLPILGNLHQIGLHPQKSFHQLSQKHGPLMLLHFGSKPVLVVSSAEMAQQIMKTHDVIFSSRAKTETAKTIFYDGKSLSLAAYGEYWRQMRSVTVLKLFSNKRVKSFQRVRQEEIQLLVKKISDSVSLQLPVDLTEMFTSVSNDVLCRVAFGRKHIGGESNKFKNLLTEMMEVLAGTNIGDYIPWLFWIDLINGSMAKTKRVAKGLDAIMNAIIEEHINRKHDGQTRTDDLVDILLEIQKDSSSGLNIERDNIKAVVLDIFVAGTDTTSTVMEWAVAELLKNPEAMKELQKEVRGVTKGREEITEEDLEEMQYLKAVIKETLRLHPPVPLLIPRESTEDVKINGYDIKAGTVVMTNAWAIGRDPETWNEPEKFLPERFLNSSIDFRGQDFQLIPFGAGRRGCPGISFAMPVNELLLATIVNRFDWSLPDGVEGKDLDMTEAVGITVHKKVPLLGIATPF